MIWGIVIGAFIGLVVGIVYDFIVVYPWFHAARRRTEAERDCEKRKRIALRDALMNVRGLLNQRQRGVEPTYSRDHITAVIKNALMDKEDPARAATEEATDA